MKTIEEQLQVILIPEIFDEVRNAVNADEVVNILRKNQSPALRQILTAIFHPEVHWDVVVPTYKPDPNPAGLSPNSLFMEARRLYLFCAEKKLDLKKKTELLLNILESVHPTEADLLVKIIRGHNLGLPLLTYNTVRQAFPDLLPLAD